MISFLFPALLAALTAVAVPIVIHFFHRRQLKVVPISTLRFLRIAEETLPRQPRMQHLLLLLLRCLLVALLGLFLAKPYLPSHGAAPADIPPPIHRLILLDQSLSMSRSDGDTTPFERARTLAADLARPLRYQDRLTPILFAQSPQPPSESHSPHHRRLAATFETAAVQPAGTSPRHALQSAGRFCDEPIVRNHRHEIFVLTDLSAGDVDEWVASASAFREARPGTRLVLVACALEPRPNFSVTTTRWIPPSASGGHALSLRVVASPPQPFETEVEVTVNGQVLGRFPARSETGQPATVELPLPSVAGNLWRGSARLTQPDALEADNERFFCFQPNRSERIFLVDGAPSAVRSLSETYYLNAALAAETEGHVWEVRSGAIEELPWDHLDSLGTIVFANVARFTEDQAARLLAFVRGGGNVIFTLGDQVSASSYNTILGAGNPGGLLPARLGDIRGDPNRRLDTFFLGDWDPGFDGFHLGNGGSDAFRQSRFFAFFETDPPDPQARVLARFHTGEAALLEKQLGDGRVYWFTSSLSAIWNDFPLRPTYLPFWRNFLRQLAALGSPPRQFLVGETARVRRVLPAADADRWLVLTPDNQRREPRQTGDSLVLTPLDQPGLYRIVDAAGTERDPGFAVHLPPTEALTAPAAAGDLARLRQAGCEVVSAADLTAVAALSRPAPGGGRPLAPWLALLVVLVAAAEWMLGNHLSREGS